MVPQIFWREWKGNKIGSDSVTHKKTTLAGRMASRIASWLCQLGNATTTFSIAEGDKDIRGGVEGTRPFSPRLLAGLQGG